MPSSLFVYSLQTRFDEVSIVWNDTNTGTIIRRIFLSSENISASILASADFHKISSAVNDAVKQFADEIDVMLSGHIPNFNISIFDFSVCSTFQRKVLMQERQIPRGEVLSYSQLALKLNMPLGARAVGNALAGNPFPLFIPCHRMVRSDGGIGGFQGGPSMKRALLEMEGITFSPSGKVLKKEIL